MADAVLELAVGIVLLAAIVASFTHFTITIVPKIVIASIIMLFLWTLARNIWGEEQLQRFA